MFTKRRCLWKVAAIAVGVVVSLVDGGRLLADPLVIQMQGEPPPSAKLTAKSKPEAHLKGIVRQKDARVVRPAQKVQPNSGHISPGGSLGAGLDDSSFTLPSRAGQTAQPPVNLNALAVPSDAGLPQAASIETHCSTQSPAIRAGQPSAAGNRTTSTGEMSLPARKKIVIKVQQYRSTNHMQFVFEGARMANILLDKGADVTVLLDLDGVGAADKNDTANAQYDRFMNSAASVRGRYASAQDLLAEFVQKGGKLAVSERWAKYLSINDEYSSPIIAGAKMLSDEEIADLFLDPAVTVVDY